jgi:hypothetical protein
MTIDHLVSPAWLLEHLNDPDIRIADLRWYLLEPGRGRIEYLEAHIPGAVYLDIDTDLAAPPFQGPGRHPIPFRHQKHSQQLPHVPGLRPQPALSPTTALAAPMLRVSGGCCAISGTNGSHCSTGDGQHGHPPVSRSKQVM